MFEYRVSSFYVYGFKKIEHLDENCSIFDYKKKKLKVFGKGLKAINLFDNTLTIKGLIEKIEIVYLGENDD